MSLESLGAELKSARELRGVPLDKIAQETRISLRHLENIERGNYGALPGGIYNRAFLRGYCEYLGLDGGDVVARYEASAAPPSEKAGKKPKGAPAGTGGSPLHPLVLWSVMLAVSVVGIYLSKTWIAVVFSPYFARPRVEPAARKQSVEPPAPREAPKAEPEPALGESVAAPRALVPAAAANPSPETAVTPGVPVSLPVAPRSAMIQLRFEVISKCWVSVTSDGTRVLVKLLEPGDDLTFEAMERFYVKLGNAGGVRVKLNGRPARAFGAPGEVVTVLINRENLDQMFDTIPR